jgi:hypothetical protein
MSLAHHSDDTVPQGGEGVQERTERRSLQERRTKFAGNFPFALHAFPVIGNLCVSVT